MTKIPCLKLFLFFQHPSLDKRYRYCHCRGMIQFHLMPVVSHLYIRKRSVPKIDPCGTPQFISPASEKTFSSVTKNFLFERYDWNHLMTDCLKPIHSIFCKSTVWSNVSNAFCRSPRIIPVWNPLSIPLKRKSVSYTRQEESVEKFAQKPDWYF